MRDGSIWIAFTCPRASAHSVTASFAQTSFYKGSTVSSGFTVEKNPSTTTIVQPADVVHGQPVSFTYTDPNAGDDIAAFQDSAGNELAQPVRQDVAGDPQPRLEFLEMVEVVEGAADDKEGPLFSDQFNSGRQRTPQRVLAERIDRGRDLALGQSVALPSMTRSKHKALQMNSSRPDRGRIPFALAQ